MSTSRPMNVLVVLFLFLGIVGSFVLRDGLSHSNLSGQRYPLRTPFYASGILGDKSSSRKAASSRSSSTTFPIQIKEVKRSELRTAAGVCIEAFFGVADAMNPIKGMQLATLLDEQFGDLKSRYGKGPRSVMFQAVDESGMMQGFVELSVQGGMKYGMGDSVNIRDERPYLANLSVRPAVRGQGIGKQLVKACEDTVQSWGYDEMILQVEDNNMIARQLYQDLGYEELWTDSTGRKYELQGVAIKSVRINKICMRKALPKSNPFSDMWKKLQASF